MLHCTYYFLLLFFKSYQNPANSVPEFFFRLFVWFDCFGFNPPYFRALRVVKYGLRQHVAPPQIAFLRLQIYL